MSKFKVGDRIIVVKLNCNPNYCYKTRLPNNCPFRLAPGIIQHVDNLDIYPERLKYSVKVWVKPNDWDTWTYIELCRFGENEIQRVDDIHDEEWRPTIIYPEDLIA